ncbi:MAG: carboxypeptidase M32 [Clostridia bacterium]|nr:carboxypeptidase M32 [Clostridia bacterium]
MTTQQATEALSAYEKTSFALNHAMGVIYYDGATVAPRGSAGVRGSTLGELSRISYELTTAPETVEMLQTLRDAQAELDRVTARKVEQLWLGYDRMRKIPIDEYVAYQELCTTADAVWHEAKVQNDYASFEPYLQNIFDTSRKIALYTDPDRDPYNTMLDLYERGLDTDTCDAFFAALRTRLVPLIERVTAHADRVDDTPLKQNFPIEIQRRFSDYLMDIMCLDRAHCIIGETEHPFTTDFSKHDVRITTHYHENALASSLYSVVHEGGHALYELHTGDELVGSVLGTGVSMAIHESQSRFYENIIGRSRAFCGLIYPWLKENFAPALDGTTPDSFWRMINRAEPSLIRTESDELTYSLHIMVRYELERRMIAGDITARELPEAWRDAYRRYLGVEVPDDRRGVLQDSHWAGGSIGYFPSYAIGSAYGAQYLRQMQRELDVDAVVASGSLAPINDWFESRIWRHGCMMDPVPLFESVCGKFDPNVYLDYLEKKFSEVYSL